MTIRDTELSKKIHKNKNDQNVARAKKIQEIKLLHSIRANQYNLTINISSCQSRASDAIARGFQDTELNE